VNNIPPPNHHNQSNFAPNQDNTSTPTTTNLTQNIPQLQQQPQLMQQLQQTSLPAPKPPSTPVNNQTSKVNILPQNTSASAVANAVAAPITTKTELPQISPTGNNNKSNINLNHLTQNNQQQQMMQQIPNNPSQQSSLMNMNIPNTQGQVVNMMSSVPQAPAALLAQQNAPNLNQIKHQAAQFGMNVFGDSLEHTLASLVEQQPISSQKNEMAMFMELQHQQKMMMNQLSGTGPNGFGDFNGVNGVNNLMNMLAMPNMDPNNLIFNAAQMKSRSFPDNTWQTNNPMIKPNSSQSNVNPMQLPTSQQQQQQMQLPPPPQQSASQNNQQQQQPQQQTTMPQPSPKAPKAMLTPKPIEELMSNPNERNKSAMSGSSSFSSSFNKSEQNLKNASSWSQLGAGSPQNMGTPNTSTKSKVPSTDTFQEFKNKAKEQVILRQRQEQEKIKKQKEQELKRQQQESLQKQKINDDLSNGHK
jgi:hypothetical protein